MPSIMTSMMIKCGKSGGRVDGFQAAARMYTRSQAKLAAWDDLVQPVTSRDHHNDRSLAMIDGLLPIMKEALAELKLFNSIAVRIQFRQTFLHKISVLPRGPECTGSIHQRLNENKPRPLRLVNR